MKERIAWSRVLSLVVAAIYLGPCLFQPGPGPFFKAATFMAIPFLSIWFPLKTAEFVSAWYNRGDIDDVDPPERLIVALAWIVYLLPLLWVLATARALVRH
ncbi:MAG TPA: hypothetical protein VFV19_05020 [Candidatus Polarisedimenticolaceae bacterium]|nr:hypothetical protein [Candidatus Polarisedimenticolaceae bacterium]